MSEDEARDQPALRRGVWFLKMIDRKHIGRKREAFKVDVEKGQIKLFAKAIGENDPLYSDENAARAAGHPSILAPPTFVFSLSLSDPAAGTEFAELEIDPANVLHAEQSFAYFKPIHAGDRLIFETELIDIYEKKGGALEFFVNRTTATNQLGEQVAQMDSTCVVRH